MKSRIVNENEQFEKLLSKIFLPEQLEKFSEEQRAQIVAWMVQRLKERNKEIADAFTAGAKAISNIASKDYIPDIVCASDYDSLRAATEKLLNFLEKGNCLQ